MQNHTTIIKSLEMIEEGYSTREIRELLHLSSETLNTINKRFKALGITLDELKNMPPQKIEDSIFYKTRKRDESKIMPDYKKVHQRLTEKKSKANLYFLWLEYKRENPDGYQYTQFKVYYRKWLNSNGLNKELKMAVERIPGEIVYIDWAGDTLACVEDESGKLIKAHFFITTLGVSSLIFVKAYGNEKMSSFIDGVVSSLKYYKALPKFLKPDNLKTGITKHSKDELILTSAFKDLGDFYDVIVLPPPPKKPTGKASVESGVKFIETHIIERLKNRIFSSFDELNEVIMNIIYELNNRKRSGEKTRKELFDTYDRPNMRNLPGSYFSVYDYKVQTVPSNYHLEYDNHYYSVPHSYFRQELILKASTFDIIICDRANKLIAKHKRSYKAYPKYITIDDHMPKEHLFYKEVNSKDGNYFRNWAKVFGDNFYEFIDRILKAYDYEPQAYNSVNGILHMAKNYPKALVDEVAKECLLTNNIKYSYFKATLTSKRSSTNKGDTLPSHTNIRGKEEYK